MPQHIVLKLSQQHLLTRIIEEPDFVQLIQEVSPEILSKLIHHIGLEDAGEIVGLATTEQLKQIFDEDLWKTAAIPAISETSAVTWFQEQYFANFADRNW